MKLAEWFERNIVIDDDPLTGTYDAVIGVGIDTTPDGREPSPHSEAVAWKCRELFFSGSARQILFVGGYHTPGGLAESVTMGQFLSGITPRNLIEGRLLLETLSDRTYRNADATRRIATDKRWRRVIVVSQQVCARHTKAIFRKRLAGSGIEVAVVKAQSPYTQNCSQWHLRSFWRFLMWDTVSFLVGKLKGWN